MQLAVISTEHARLIRRHMLRRGLRSAAIRDQALFLDWAQEQWPVFERNMAMWAIANDPIDPHEEADRAFADRYLVSSQIGESVLVEAMVPALMWEQVIVACQPHVDRMFKEDWAEAQNRLGPDAEITSADLLRTDRQRFLDALVTVSRASLGADDPGAQIVVNLVADLASVENAANRREAAIARREEERVRAQAELARQAAARAEEANAAADADGNADQNGLLDETAFDEAEYDDWMLDLSLSDAYDAGVPLPYVPIKDQPGFVDTLPAMRRLAQAEGVLESQPIHQDVESMRCRTESGLTISPDTALMGVLAGTIRRFTLDLPSLDFEASSKARLFEGAKRLGIMIRDEHCQGIGCDTHSSKCEADHIVPHSRGGPTVPTNGDAKCAPCHRWKTRTEALGLA